MAIVCVWVRPFLRLILLLGLGEVTEAIRQVLVDGKWVLVELMDEGL